MIYMRSQEHFINYIIATVSSGIIATSNTSKKLILKALSRFKGRKLSKITDLVFETDDNTNAKMYIKLLLLSKLAR